MRPLLALLLISLSGCLDGLHPVQQSPQGEDEMQPYAIEGRNCETVVIFFLIDYALADPHLPPGFHVEDLAQFIYYSPAFAGKTAMFAASQTCERAWVNGPQLSQSEDDAGTVENAFYGFFVQNPDVAWAEASTLADFNFYILQWRTNNHAQMFEDFGWNLTQTTVLLDVDQMVQQPLEPAPVPLPTPTPSEFRGAIATGSVGADNWFNFSASSGYPLAIGHDPLLRFWHVGEKGLSFIEFQPDFDTIPASNSQTCSYQEGSILAEVLTDRPTGPAACHPLAAFNLIFPPHDLEGGRLHLRPGDYP